MTVATETPTECRPSAKLKLDELFVQWFHLPDTQQALSRVLDEAAHTGMDADRQHLGRLMLTLPSDGGIGKSPPGSPTANGLSSLSLSTSPRTPPRSPDSSAQAAARTALALARSSGALDGDDILPSPAKAGDFVPDPPSPLGLGSPALGAAGMSVDVVAAAGSGGAVFPSLAGITGPSSPTSPALSPRGRILPFERARLSLGSPLSPQKRPLGGSPRDASDVGSEGGDPHATRQQANKKAKEQVGTFYLPLGRETSDVCAQEAAAARMELIAAAQGAALVPQARALEVCTSYFGLPSAVARVLLDRLASPSPGPGAVEGAPAAAGATGAAVSVAALERFHADCLVGLSPGTRIFHALGGGLGAARPPLGSPPHSAADRAALAASNPLTVEELRPLVRAVVDHHPGLAFLAATPEFQDRYVETVVLRILYSLSRCGPCLISRMQVEKSMLPAALDALDADEDINHSTTFFSYEHFYVIYCRFWELDDDHDMRLSKEDLSRYADYSLNSRIVDRVFHLATSGARGEGGGGGGSGNMRSAEFGVGAPGEADGAESQALMTYAQFVWFVLSEEDKTSRTALEYWFRRVDLDGDGYISGYEIDFFYAEQLHRMRCMGQEVVELPDVTCQLFDLVKPAQPKKGIRLGDLRGNAVLGSKMFDVLFNLNKFLMWESKDPHAIREERAQPHLSDWDRFCKREYLRLALEDEPVDSVGAEPDPMAWAEVEFGSAGGHLGQAASHESPF